MLCPIDQTELKIADRQGVEIDYCPQCRGVWLDRGELDKILDRAAADRPPPPAGAPAPGRPYGDARGRDWDDDDDRYRGGPGWSGRRRKRSFLDDLFDFG